MNIKMIRKVKEMTKGEFLYNIRNNLTMLPKEEVEGIIEDYSMHINELLDEGESLEDILAKLGDPKDIAKQYIEELGYEDKKEEVKYAERNYESYKSKNNNVTLFVIMQIINFLVVIWIVLGLATAIASVGISGIAVAVSSFAVLFFNTSVSIGIRVLKMFVLLGVGVLLFNAALAIAILFVKLIIKYVKWNISLIS